jgi:DNA polymerase-3 subunit alpha
MRYGQRVQQDKQNAQQSLFGMGGGSSGNLQQPKPPVAEDWNDIIVLNKEKEVIGLYLSAHPLNRFDFILEKMCQASLSDLANLEALNGREVSVAGVVTSVTPLTTKDGRRYARFILEDYNTQHEFTLWSKEYEQWGILIEINNFLFIKGRVQHRFGNPDADLEYKMTIIQPLAKVADSITSIRIELNVNEICPTLTEMIAKEAEQNPGNVTLGFTIVDRQNDVRVRLSSKRYRVAATTDFMNFLERNELNYFINV